MADKQKISTKAENRRLRLTVQLSLEAYDAIEQIRRQHRIKNGKELPKWKAIDEAVRAYAKQKGIRVEK
jgi:hypothetical protein